MKIIISTGDTFGFEVLYDRYAPKVYQKCLSFSKDRAEAKDLAHDIFVKIFLSLKNFNFKSQLSTWIYRITYNHCVDYQAKKTKQNTLKEELTVELPKTLVNEPTDSQILEINVKILNELLNKLTVSEKTILLMKYQDEMSIKEISAMLSAGESAVKMKLKRSKEKLRRLYEERR